MMLSPAVLISVPFVAWLAFQPEPAPAVSVWQPAFPEAVIAERDCDGECSDMTGGEADCKVVFGYGDCHAWEWQTWGIHEDGSVNDGHVQWEGYEFGESNCGSTHYWCSGLTAREIASVVRALGTADLASLDRLVRDRSDVWVELNLERSAVQLIGTCPADPEGRVFAHVPVAAGRLAFWETTLTATTLGSPTQ